MRIANGHVIRAFCPRCWEIVLPGPLIGLGRLYECKACPNQPIMYQVADGDWRWARYVYPEKDTPTPPPDLGPVKPAPPPGYARTRPIRPEYDIRALCTACCRRAQVIVGPYRRTIQCRDHPAAPCLIVEGDWDGKPEKHGYVRVFFGTGYRDQHREARVEYVAAGEWSRHHSRPMEVRDRICSLCHRSILERHPAEVRPGVYQHLKRCPTEFPNGHQV